MLHLAKDLKLDFDANEYWANANCPTCKKLCRLKDEFGFWSCARCDRNTKCVDYSSAEKKKLDTWSALHGRKNTDSNKVK